MTTGLTCEVLLGGFLYDPLSSRRNCVAIGACSRMDEYVGLLHMLLCRGNEVRADGRPDIKGGTDRDNAQGAP